VSSPALIKESRISMTAKKAVKKIISMMINEVRNMQKSKTVI
jgi:hypothetical protein